MDKKTREEMIRYIMANLGDAVCLTDKHGVLQLYNPAAESLFGLASGGSPGQRLWEYIPFVETNDDLIQLFIDAVHTRRSSCQRLVPYENRQGKTFHFRVSLSYREEYGGMFIIIVSDLTELIKVTDAFTRYTSPQIAEYVLSTPEGEARDGETRDVTILMSDLRGFTAMSTSMAAKPLVDMLNHYFAQMVEVVSAFQGTVIEFLGDGIFVVFGAPQNDPGHAGHAVACAVEMQNAMEEVNRWNRENGFPDLSMGIGICSGSCVVGNIGSSQKMKYGCVGESVNLAGRVESQTVGSQILISESTAALVSEPLTVPSRFTFLPKGAKAPVTVYEIAGIGTEHRLQKQKEDLSWIRLKQPPVLPFHLLNDDKSVDPETLEAEITAISDDGRHLLVRTDPLPGFHRNVLAGIGSGAYGKVIGREEEAAVVCLTSLPKDYEAWVRNLQ